MGNITPSTNDGSNHVVKIVCGRGSHSNGRAVLKFAVPQYLVSDYTFINIYIARARLRHL